ESPAGDALDVWGGGLAAMRAGLARVPLVALVSRPRPLLGFHGLAASTIEGRDSDRALAAAAQDQERRWQHVALEGDALARQSLVGSGRLSDAPGSGAAGGLAYCLAAAGARLAPAAAFVADLAGVNAVVAPDLVVAVCSPLSPAELDHGTVAPASARAAAVGVPCIAIAPDVHVGKRDLMAAGVAAAFAAGPGLEALRDQVRRTAQTWTPTR